jgi:hypothetical protein
VVSLGSFLVLKVCYKGMKVCDDKKCIVMKL